MAALVAGGGTSCSGLDRSQEFGVYPIRQETQLMPRQVDFFTWFNFTLSYCPSSKNTKSVALSRVFSSNPSSSEPSSIRPSSCVIGAITWAIESRVHRVAGKETTPDGCPPNRLCVPTSLHSQLIHWAHMGLFACYPGVKRTMFIIRQWLLWLRMEREVGEYVAACPIRARTRCHTPGLPVS